MAGERGARLRAAPAVDVEDARDFRAAPAAALRARTFDRWFARHVVAGVVDPGHPGRSHAPAARVNDPGYNATTRGRVILWNDTFVRYHEPHIGIAAVAVLEALGFEVVLAQGRVCCGRPAFSQGNLDEAKRLGRHNLDLLQTNESNTPIVFLEPSCYSMFVEDYRELNVPGFEAIAPRCFLFERFVEDILSREPDALHFKNGGGDVAIHAHCHAKSLMKPGFMAWLAERLPGRKVTLLETGCCGMAGAFGALDSKYQLSLQVAAPLVQKIGAQPAGATIVASGTSCRHQIEHLTPVHPKHMAELLADALA